MRIGIGAAIVLLILALIIAVVVAAFGQESGSTVVAPAGATPIHTPNGPGPGQSSQSSQSIQSSRSRGTSPTAEPEAGTGSNQGIFLFVHVLGAVRKPGLFQLAEGARVVDAIAAAGGLAETGDPAGVNLARSLSDGEQLYVPAVGEVPPPVPPGGGASGGSGSGGAATGPVNLNTATVADLDSLPRIGPAMAQRIVDFRTANGKFTSIDELRNVVGIGEKTFDGLKDLVTV
jgi:competence protein ComEA